MSEANNHQLIPNATFQNENRLICAFPSSKDNGVYLVEIKPFQKDLVITHDCPACRYNKPCKHIQAAVAAYRRWQWQEPYKSVHRVTQKIILDPNWKQIELSQSPKERIMEVMRDAT